MGKVEKCKEGSYKNFEKIRQKIIEESQNFINKYDHEGKRKYYLGMSIYRLLPDSSSNKYEIIYSLSFFKNSERQSIIRENDFSGLIFEKITIPQEDNILEENKDFSYLKYFFDDIDLDCEYSYIFGKKVGDYIVQFIFVYCEDIIDVKYSKNFIEVKYKKNVTDVKHEIKENIVEFLSNIDNAIGCIPYSNIKLKIKDSKVLEDNYILIFDLKRNNERKKDELVNADAVLTRKLIFDILAIANNYNFKSLNHIGDGFILIYMENKQNLANDLLNFFSKIEITLNELSKYLSSLTREINNYKIRGIIDLCPKLFEFTYFSSYGNKIFYSKYLDEIFDRFKQIFIDEEDKVNAIDDSILKSDLKDTPALFAVSKKISLDATTEIPELDEEFNFWYAKKN